MPYEKTTWKSRDLITASKMNNIENGIETAGEDKFVRYDVTQNLTETQKTRARENIGAAGEGGGSSSGGGGFMLVNVEPDDSTGESDEPSYVADKTFAEIKQAYENGVMPIVTCDESLFHLYRVASDYCRFEHTYLIYGNMGGLEARIRYIDITKEGDVELSELNGMLSQSEDDDEPLT